MEKLKLNLADYHIHTRRCGHATGAPGAYVAAARAAGLREIGFADHIPLYWLPEAERDPGLAMREEELAEYVAEVARLREENPDLTIRLGIEADFVPGQTEKLAAALLKFPFDYVIGAVHYIDGWGFDHPDKLAGYGVRDIRAIYNDYFGLLQEAARSGLFDILAHPDLVKKFGYRPEGDLRPWYEETAAVFAACGVCVEVNTAGLRAPAGEIYPALDFLKACREHNVPATAGSDAHAPAQVGYAWEQALEWLQAAGYREAAVFEKRRRRPVLLK